MKNAILAAALGLLLAGRASAQQPPTPPASPKPTAPSAADTDKDLYAVGLAVAKSLEVFSLQPGELDKVIAGLRDGVAGKPKFQLDEKTQQGVQDLARYRMSVAADKEKLTGVAYLAKMAKQPGAEKTASGAIVVPEKAGTGAAPAATDTVKVHYVGTLVDGKEFDSSVKRGEPAEFPLNGVIKCWTEALQKMKVGGKAKVICPADIAYGEQGRPPVIPGNAVLTFQIELLDVKKAPPAPAPAAPPAGKK